MLSVVVFTLSHRRIPKMAIGKDDFDIDMPTFDAGSGSSGSGQFDYSPEEAYYDSNQSQYDSYNPDNYDLSQEDPWTGYDPWATDNYLWASDEELDEAFSYDGVELPAAEGEDSDFWGGVWDFVSSDGMLDFVRGAIGVGASLLNKPRSSGARRSGGGGGSGRAIHQSDPGKVKEKALTFSQR